VTPIAVLEPVAVGGVTVSRASLHNISVVRKKGVKVRQNAAPRILNEWEHNFYGPALAYPVPI
jgi:DNA ligase (NAD+)